MCGVCAGMLDSGARSPAPVITHLCHLSTALAESIVPFYTGARRLGRSENMVLCFNESYSRHAGSTGLTKSVWCVFSSPQARFCE